MDRVQSDIRVKIVAAGYRTIEDLPNTPSLKRWKKVKQECALTSQELNRLINSIFPQSDGDFINFISHTAIPSHCFCCL